MRKTGGKLKSVERFACDVLCSRKGVWDDDARASRGCTRADLPPVEWHVDAMRIHIGGWMGREPVRESTQSGIPINPKQPTEDPSEGCPGGWYRSTLIASLAPYLRRRDAQGGRVANLMLDRTEDETLIQLAMLLEDYSELWESHALEKVNSG